MGERTCCGYKRARLTKRQKKPTILSLLRCPRKEANADQELIKKLKEDEKAVVACTDRLQTDLELLNTVIRFIN